MTDYTAEAEKLMARRGEQQDATAFALRYPALQHAAPDLLRALLDVLPHVGVGYSGMQRHAILERARAAIAKAEGRPCT